MPRVIHFEINADDTQRAAKFYRELFDWKISRWNESSDYWLTESGTREEPGIDGIHPDRLRGRSTEEDW